MSKKTDLWMPLFIADYLADTSRLTTEQHGAYLLLLMDYWRNGPPPDDDAILARITGLSPDAWSIARRILQPFFLVEHGVWRQGRLEAEIEVSKQNKESAKSKGRAGAKARWEKAKQEAEAIAGASLEHKPEDSPSPPPSPQPVLKPHTSAEPPVPHMQIIELYNEILPMLTQVKPKLWSGARAKALQARWREDKSRQTLDWWRGWFEYVGKSDFLTGRSGSWSADLGWLLIHGNFVKVCEGKYHG